MTIDSGRPAATHPPFRRVSWFSVFWIPSVLIGWPALGVSVYQVVTAHLAADRATEWIAALLEDGDPERAADTAQAS